MPTTLLSENDEWNRNLLAHSLARPGLLVHSVAGEGGGIELAHMELPDLIPKSLALSAMDGGAVSGYLKGAPLAGLIPPIALTARAFRGDRKKTSDIGFTDITTRSADLSCLLEKIRLLLAQTMSGGGS